MNFQEFCCRLHFSNCKSLLKGSRQTRAQYWTINDSRCMEITGPLPQDSLLGMLVSGLCCEVIRANIFGVPFNLTVRFGNRFC